MYIAQKFFNYITLILAIMTVGTGIYSGITKKTPVFFVILLILTILLNAISRVYNNRNIDLTKEDREFLNLNKK